MCSIVEDEFGDDPVHVMPKDEEDLKTRLGICKKCKENDAVLKLKVKEEQCESCFLHYVRHKFRATLGSTKVVKRDSNVLLDITGTAENVCLLDMIKFALEQEAHKKLVFNLQLILVDEFIAKSNDSSEDQIKSKLENIDKIKDVIKKYSKFQCYYIPISYSSDTEILKLDDVNFETLKKHIEDDRKFLKILTSIKSLTSRQDFLAESRKNILYKSALSLQCNFVFLPEIGIDLAKKLISNIALGRGASVSQDVGFCDDRLKDVKIIRPLRELDVEEVNYYVKFNSLPFIPRIQTEGFLHSSTSIQNLTSNFINGLQQNFSSTISTVFRTGDKISTSNSKGTQSLIDGKLLEKLNISQSDNLKTHCLFCKGVLDIFDSKTLPAIEYSRLISASANNGDESALNEIIKKAEHSVITGNDPSIHNLQKHLCHACRTIFNDLEDKNDIEYDLLY